MIAQQFMDPELLIIIGCIIVALILLRVFSNFLSRHKILKIAVVGDAPSDLMAAKSAGMVFVGVLTGIDRKSANEYFLSHNADYIFEDVTQLIDD